MGAYRVREADVPPQMLQQAIDATDVIGRWEYDVPNDRVYTDTLVALVFNVDPALAETGASLDVFLAGVHPEDRARTAREIRRSAETGLCCTIEYRVCSADGVVRWVLDRGRIVLDEAGRPQRGSGVVIDMTRTRCRGEASPPDGHDPDRNPLENAAEHCLAAHKALQAVPEPLLQRMSDMLLLEVGRSLARLVDERRRGGVEAARAGH
jgi:hypothetical protein